MQFDRLALHSHILPLLKKLEQSESLDTQIVAEGLSSVALDAEVFDCRQLPEAFVDDAGEAAYSDLSETGALVKLPYPSCCFEFADQAAIIACEREVSRGSLAELPGGGVSTEDSVLVGTAVEMFAFVMWSNWDRYSEASGLIAMHAEFPNGIRIHEDHPDPPFLDIIVTNVLPKDTERSIERLLEAMGKRLLGVLGLLTDKLLSSTHAPDPAPRLTQARVKRGKLPITGPSHILRVNVAAIRAAARPPKEGTHESPCLHWRRGHWRVLHRGSEFEGQAWVKRCLVGDPSRGFVSKTYRLVREQPQLEASPAT